jgi:molybdate transport system substrate-binding protein
MKRRSLLIASHIGCMLLLMPGVVARAAEMKVLSSISMQSIMEDLGPKFERATGHKLAITFDSVGGVVKRVQSGESADVVVNARQGIEPLVADGKTAVENVIVVAHSFVGAAVRKGAPHPDISSPDALKRTLLAAKSVTYSNPAFGGVSGVQVVKVFERRGIADEMKRKTVFLPKPGPVAGLVANGEAELALQHVAELLPVPGIDVIGPLPSTLQEAIVMWAAIMRSTKDAEASTALVHFLRTPEAAAVIKAKGMEPATP